VLTMRTMAGLGVGALGAAVALIAPALGAPEGPRVAAIRQTIPVGIIGGFTPSSADPKLAAILARSGIDGSSFRFTPSEGQRISKRAVTVAVRARTQPAAMPERAAVDSNVGPTLAPIAYNLGTSVGWKRFAAAGDLAKLDLGVQPGNQDRLGTGTNKTRRASSVSVGADKPGIEQSKLVADAPGGLIDVGGSYSLTRHFDVTAGLRYKTERDRLLRLEDTRRDSQALYVGTAFRF
jgi:hypothetical protein